MGPFKCSNQDHYYPSSLLSLNRKHVSRPDILNAAWIKTQMLAKTQPTKKNTGNFSVGKRIMEEIILGAIGRHLKNKSYVQMQ